MANNRPRQPGKTQLRIFVSSVQKELEDERVIVQNLIHTDPFLSMHCTPVLYEDEPASPDKSAHGCIKALENCQVYVLIVWQEYGTPVAGLSMTHQEYRRAKELSFPVLAFIKGTRSAKREPATDGMLKEIEADGLKYKRFGNVIELQKEVRAALAGVHGVDDIHELHVWSLTDGFNAISAHLVVKEKGLFEQVLKDATCAVGCSFNIKHCAFQVESEPVENSSCDICKH